MRYGLIGFNGIANEHSAKLSQLTDDDYERFLEALWRSVPSAPTANTRSKMGQVPRLLVDITYKPESEFQFGCLFNYAKVVSKDKPEAAFASPDDYDSTSGVWRIVWTHPAVESVRCRRPSRVSAQPQELPWKTWDLFGSLKVVKGA